MGGNAQSGMMVESPPASAFKMPQADFLLEFLVVAFNAPPKLGGVYQLFKGGKVKRIPPSASATAIFAAQYIRAFVPGGAFFFSFRLRNAAGRWNNANGGMRCAFPP
jgi:hypothetical protein